MAHVHQYPEESFRVAAVQASPEYLDRKATTEKACRLVREAAGEGADIIGFPETFIPGYPYWNWVNAPIDGYDWYKRYRRESVDVPGPEVDQLRSVADETATTLVVGITERDPTTVGTLYNTNLVISHEGQLLGKHRKLVPTHAEKLSWGRGDGSSLRTYETPHGNLGTLACGENTNPLARYALMAQGEQIHVSNYPAFHFDQEYDIARATRIRSLTHAFEGKLFNVVSTEYFDDSFFEVCETDRARELLGGDTQSYFTAVVGPTGEVLAGPLGDEEGIVYADVSLEDAVEPKLMHDVVGQYNRFDVFDFAVDRDELAPFEERRRRQPESEADGASVDRRREGDDIPRPPRE
ncbi:MAG: carbon-nitrogen hydrolase family protein [Haloarculaceae archaeon]